MKFIDIIQVFPQALKAIPDAFNTEDLQDLDATLAGLDTQPAAELIETLKSWFQTHTNARDTIIQFADDNNREIKRLPRKSLNSEAEILENLFELRKTNRDTLADKTNPPPTDSKETNRDTIAGKTNPPPTDSKETNRDTLAGKTNPPPTDSKDAQHP